MTASDPNVPTPDPELDEEIRDDAVIGVAFRWSLVVIGGLGLVALLVLLLRPSGAPEEEQVIDRDPIEAPDRLEVAVATERPSIPFRDVTVESGIDFVHENGARGGKLLPETMGGGAAFLDVDADGDQDLFLVNAATWPDDEPRPDHARTHALYLNDGTGAFTDATAGSGLDVEMYGFGPAVGDFDADGDPDIFIAALGGDRMFRNDGDGTFTDVTSIAGVAGPDDAWCTGAGFLDHDGDGDLDLFVMRYVVWNAELDKAVGFTLNGVDRAYGPPKSFRGTDCVLWRNNGDGTFTDVSEEAGIHVRNPATNEPMGKALAAAFTDIDGDGHVDILVANDTVANFAFRNRGDGTFEELGALSGLAFDSRGMATGAMGIDVADVTGDGRLSIGIGNFSGEPTSLYLQQPADPWQFADVASMQGVGSQSRLSLSFGLLFMDADLDGRLDMLQANGHLEEEISEVRESQKYEQPTQLFWNAGDEGARRFVLMPDEEVGDLAAPIVGRAAASADIDGDGDIDVVLTQPGRAARLLRNEQTTGHRWLRVRLEDDAGRDPVGALVELVVGDAVQRRVAGRTRSYLAQCERALTFGLGLDGRPTEVRVRWPDGRRTRHSVDGFDRTVTVRSGDGNADTASVAGN